MKTIKVSEATGPALDWLVAKCEHPKTFNSHSTLRSIWSFRYSTDWAIGGRIIAREMLEHGFDLWSGAHTNGLCAATYSRGAVDTYVFGPTPLIAAMRCFCASRLGDEVEIPKELMT